MANAEGLPRMADPRTALERNLRLKSDALPVDVARCALTCLRAVR